MDEKKGLWLYCVVENKGSLNIEAYGIHGDNQVNTISYGDYAVVISQEPMKKYPLVRDFLIAHQLVNEKVMQIQPVLPVKFCTMAENEKQIIEQVLTQKDKTDEFEKSFLEIDDRNEYGLRARWKNLDQVFANLSLENEKVTTAKEKVLKLPEKERHMALIDIGHIVKEALEEKNTNLAQDFINLLTPYAFKYKENNALGDMNILNAAFLIDEIKQAEFDQMVNDLVSKYESEIQFKYVGPIPPFNFVEIVIRWEEPRLSMPVEKGVNHGVSI